MQPFTMKQLLVGIRYLLLLSTVFFYNVDSQVRVSLRGIEYSNNSLIKAEDIGKNDEALICSTDLRPCCGTPPNRFGDWYHPNGTSVQPIGSGASVYRDRLNDGMIRLHRRNEILPVDGVYKCAIPNSQRIMVDMFVFILKETSVPRISGHPQNIFNSDPGSPVSLSVTATYARNYQWQVNDTDIQESSKYKGARTDTLVIQNIQEQDEGFYSCIVGNEFLTIISEKAAVTVLNSPVILENPEDQLEVEEGTTVMFSVMASGLKLSYNWMFQNGSQLPTDGKYAGQNTSLLTIFSISRQESDSYQCQVSNPAGSVTSQPAHLSVFTYNEIETFEAIPGVTSVKLMWTLAENAQDTIDYFSLKYFPVLFPNVIDMANTTNATYEVVGLIPRAVYLFELQPIFVGDVTSKSISINVILNKPIPPVENVTVSVSSATSVLVFWNVNHEFLGWDSKYYILYYNALSPDGSHSISRRFEISNTAINITMDNLVLEADWQHHFDVSTVLVVGMEGLEVIESEKVGIVLNLKSDSALFQLLIGPTDYCVQWNVEKAARYQLAIRQKLASVISNVCDCNYPLSLIDNGVFSCRTVHNYVVYRSKITGLFASGLVDYLLEWVELNPSLQVDWLLLNVHSLCSSRINSINDPECNIPSNFTDNNNCNQL